VGLLVKGVIKVAKVRCNDATDPCDYQRQQEWNNFLHTLSRDQQVIKQVWISCKNRWISKRLPARNGPLGFIKGILLATDRV
jgi:transposase